MSARVMGSGEDAGGRKSSQSVWCPDPKRVSVHGSGYGAWWTLQAPRRRIDGPENGARQDDRCHEPATNARPVLRKRKASIDGEPSTPIGGPRWDGNSLGNSLLKDHIKLAHSSRLPVRLIVATAHNSLAVDDGWDASKIRKTFHIKPEVVGYLSHFDGDAFSIDFMQV